MIEGEDLEKLDTNNLYKRFEAASPHDIQLYAINLSRPDGFVKSLITGCIATSRELAEKVSPGFVKTHRGYYMTAPHVQEEWAYNDYLSFNIGRAQKMYGKSENPSSTDNFSGGLGVIFKAEEILYRDNSKVTYGGFDTEESLKLLEHEHRLPMEYKHYENTDNFYTLDTQPNKGQLLDLVHVARMAGQLTGDDQAEVNILAEGNKLPRVTLNTGIILIPKGSKDAMLRLIKIKLNEVTKFATQISEQFGVDVDKLTPDNVINQYPNISWYKEKNIDEAIMLISLK